MSAQLCLGEGTCRGVSRKTAGHCCLQTGGFIGEKDLVKGGGTCPLSIARDSQGTGPCVLENRLGHGNRTFQSPTNSKSRTVLGAVKD
jgi:hypothetical protein